MCGVRLTGGEDKGMVGGIGRTKEVYRDVRKWQRNACAGHSITRILFGEPIRAGAELPCMYQLVAVVRRAFLGRAIDVIGR